MTVDCGTGTEDLRAEVAERIEKKEGARVRHISEAQKPELTWRQNLGHKGADAEAELRGRSRPCGGVVVAFLPVNQLPSWWASIAVAGWDAAAAAVCC